MSDRWERACPVPLFRKPSRPDTGEGKRRLYDRFKHVIQWVADRCHARPIASVALLAASAHGAELHIGNGGEPLTLDPHRYNLNLEEKILADLFEALTAHDADGRIVPGAAKRWSVSEDGLTWTFRLREDARWSDGLPVTADDFVFSFRRLLDPATAASLAYFLYAIDGAASVNSGRTPVEELAVRALGTHVPSFRQKDFSVNELIGMGLPISAGVGLAALALALALGVAGGTFAALARDGPRVRFQSASTP